LLDFSDDEVSKSEGGYIGILLNKTSFNETFSDVLNKLEANQPSKPFFAGDGYHIIKKEILTEKDLETFHKTQFFMQKQLQILEMIRGEAEIKRFIRRELSREKHSHHEH